MIYMGKVKDWITNKVEESFAKALAMKVASVIVGAKLQFPLPSILWFLAGERAKENQRMRDELRRIGKDPADHSEIFMPRR